MTKCNPLRCGLICSVLLLSALLLTGCASSGWLSTPTPTIDLPAALTALAPSPEVSLPTPGISLDPVPTDAQPSNPAAPPQDVAQRLWVAPYLPDDIMQGMVAPMALQIVSDPQLATLQLDVTTEGVQVSSLVFALVAPFIGAISTRFLICSVIFLPLKISH